LVVNAFRWTCVVHPFNGNINWNLESK